MIYFSIYFILAIFGALAALYKFLYNIWLGWGIRVITPGIEFMKKFAQKNLIRSVIILICFVISSSIFFIGLHGANAASDSTHNVSDAVITVVSWIVYPFAYVAGVLLSVMVSILVSIAGYNDFINVDTVVKGWVVVRDLCNMFFVLILLMIAFATILRIESYQFKKALPKLIIAAVLINFSRTIFGLIIDFGQVIMMTFVNSFAVGGPSQFVQIFQIDKYLSIDSSSSAIGTMAVLGAIVAGLVAMLITLVLMIVLVAVLLMRVIMLWVYTILSPFVFLGSAFPAAQKYTSQIWGDFTKQVIVGPMLAFFIWLALNTATTSSNSLIESIADQRKSIQRTATEPQVTEMCAGINALFCEKNLQRFLITIALLIGGLMVTQQMGGFAGQMAGKGMGWIQKGKGFTTGLGKKLVGGVALGGAKTAGRLGLAGASFADRYLGKKATGLIGKVPGLAGKGITLGEKGLVGAGAAALMNVRNIGSWVSRKMSKNESLNTALRDFNQDKKKEGVNARLSYENKSYKLNDSGKFEDEDDKKNILKHNGQEVAEMGDAKSAWLDAWHSAQSGAKIVSERAQEEQINKAQKDIADKHLTTSEMLRRMEDATTSNTEKMALALTLAVKEGFKNKNNIDKARSALSGNKLLRDKFDDQVDKRQAHIAYNLDASDHNNDIAKFKDRVDSGKIDLSKQSKDAYKDKEFIKAVADYEGDEFDDLMKTVSKKSNSHKEAVKVGLKESIGAEEQGIYNKSTGKLDKFAKNYAKITGDYITAFTDKDGKYQINALNKYVKGSKASDLAKISKKMFNPAEAQKIMSAAKVQIVGGVQGTLTSNDMINTIKKGLGRNVSSAKVKSLYKTGESEELIKEIVGAISDAANTGNKDAAANYKKIQGDSDLSSIIS